jgi:hypothetical protein
MKEVKGACGNLKNEEFHDLHCSPNIIQVTQSKSMKWVGDVSRKGRRAMHTGFRWGNRKEKDHMEDQILEGRILKHLKETGWKDVQWINRAKERDTRMALVKTVMNFRVA